MEQKPNGKWIVVFQVFLGVLITGDIGLQTWLFKGLRDLEQKVTTQNGQMDTRVTSVETWQRNRPDFITKDKADLELIRQEKALRELFNLKIESQFSAWDTRYIAATKLNEDAHTRIIESLGALKDQLTLLAERQVTSLKTLEKLEKGKP